MSTAAPAAEPVLAAQDIRLDRAGRTVLNGVSVRFVAGQWTAIVGANGAGKSTLLSVLAGLQRPDAGQVSLAGRPLTAYPAAERARLIAWLGQYTELDAALSVQDLVHLGRLPHLGPWRAAGAADHAAVARALHDAAISALATQQVARLSGGQRQQALIARALATEAPVLLLDEPTTHLDPAHQRALHAALTKRQHQGTAVITVLHDLNQALRADQLVLMTAGQPPVCGAPQDPHLRAALCAAFDHAIRLVQMNLQGATQWIAVPQ